MSHTNNIIGIGIMDKIVSDSKVSSVIYKIFIFNIFILFTDKPDYMCDHLKHFQHK